MTTEKLLSAFVASEYVFSDLQLFQDLLRKDVFNPRRLGGLEQVLFQKRERERASHFDTP